MHHEIRAPSLHATLWWSLPEPAIAGDAVATSLIVPDGCMDLIAFTGSPALAEVVVAGADSAAREFRSVPMPVVGLRFDPGVLPQLLRTSGSELTDAVTPLDALIPIPSGAASKRRWTMPPGEPSSPEVTLAQPPIIAGKVRELLGLGRALLGEVEIDPRPLALADALRPRAPRSASIAEVAADLAYSPRQLRRLAADWFGYGPKHLAKILRWQEAMRLVETGHTRTSAAAEAGYSDVAHLWREEKSLLGR